MYTDCVRCTLEQWTVNSVCTQIVPSNLDLSAMSAINVSPKLFTMDVLHFEFLFLFYRFFFFASFHFSQFAVLTSVLVSLFYLILHLFFLPAFLSNSFSSRPLSYGRWVSVWKSIVLNNSKIAFNPMANVSKWRGRQRLKSEQNAHKCKHGIRVSLCKSFTISLAMAEHLNNWTFCKTVEQNLLLFTVLFCSVLSSIVHNVQCSMFACNM